MKCRAVVPRPEGRVGERVWLGMVVERGFE